MKKSILTLLSILLCVTLFSQNATKSGKAYMVSDAHFDSQWNWDVQRSISEFIPKTMNQNIMLLQKYPDYIFNFEGGVKYAWMKEYFPLEFELVKKYVKEGRWHIAGSTWDATDTNIPSPESFTRNILYGQMFYEDEFGVKSTDIFLPDCFGFSWILPSIASHSGLIGFSTQKLMWRHKAFYDSGKTPFEIGLWQGVDGAKIMLVADAHNYTTKWRDEDLSESKYLEDIVKKSPIKTVYHYYGTGDTGGAPTIESVRAVEQSLNGKGPVQIVSATSDQLYKDYLPFDKHPELPVFNGELLMDVHGTGCYTSQAAMKLYNRKNELLGDASERAAVMADWLGAIPYPKHTLTEAWKRFVWHQFHDDLTGTSIPRAYEFSWNDELISLKQFEDVMTSSVGAVSRYLNTKVKGTPVVIYNPMSMTVSETVEIMLPSGKESNDYSIYDDNGKSLPVQKVSYADGKVKLLVTAHIPSCGYVVYDVRKGSSKSQQAMSVKINHNEIENSIYRVRVDENGDIASVYDKKNQKELVEKGKKIRLALFPENESFQWPAWEILKKEIDKDPVSIAENVKIYIAEKGSLRASLCVERSYGDSKFKQYIRLNEGAQSDRIDIVNEIDWQTTNALLKAEFPLTVSNPEATYDLGLGTVKRGNNTDIAYEVYGQYWADLTARDNSYGVAVLNDSKYGWDKPNDNTLRLTLLHTPKTQGGYSYQSKQDFGKHYFTYSIVGHAGDWNDAGIVAKAELLNQAPKPFLVDKHDGELGRNFSFVKTNNDHVLMKAFKEAEKSDEYIVRLYETTGKSTQSVTLSFPANVISAKDANGIEETLSDLNFSGKDVKIEIKPYGIKTLKIKLSSPNISVVATHSAIVELPYDTKAATYNAFRTTSNFDGKGNSYAAELFPAEVDYKGIKFQLKGADVDNVVKSRSQTVALPQGNYNKLYLLVASSGKDVRATVVVDGVKTDLIIPGYSGFVGQWGHTGQTQGFLKPANIAFVGTHKHNMLSNKDIPYEYTYMFAVALDIPLHAKQLTLPDNSKVMVFAATVTNDLNNSLQPAQDLLNVHLAPNIELSDAQYGKNLLFGKTVIGKSGQVNEKEKAEYAIDEDPSTKWCDVSISKPKYMEVDLGKEEEIHGWSVFHAGLENLDYITKEYSLQVKQTNEEQWKTVDTVYDNTQGETDRLLNAPVKARFVRLNITKPDQSEGEELRIYDFQVY